MRRGDISPLGLSIIVHAFLIGVPIGLFVRRAAGSHTLQALSE